VILQLDETKFRYLLNDNAMATEKRLKAFPICADVVKLEKFVASKVNRGSRG